MSDEKSFKECFWAQRLNPNLRVGEMNVDRGMLPYVYYVIQNRIHLIGFFDYFMDNCFRIVARSTSPEGLCVELDHIEALDEHRRLLEREALVRDALRDLKSEYSEDEASLKAIEAVLGDAPNKPSLWTSVWNRLKLFYYEAR